MDRNFTNLVKEVSSYSISDIKEKTRNKIKERIEELRKNDDLFLKEFERGEKNLWSDILFNNDETLRNLIKYYHSIISLKNEVDLFLRSTN